MSIITVGIALAKNVFAVHGVDDNGKSVLGMVAGTQKQGQKNRNRGHRNRGQTLIYPAGRRPRAGLEWREDRPRPWAFKAGLGLASVQGAGLAPLEHAPTVR